jgi:transcriptional regulator with XRE-family HTH domain
MKKESQLIPLLNFFAETLRETRDESDLSQAEIARHCGIPPGLWINLQPDYEFMRANREKGDAISKEVQPCAA